MGVKTKTRPPRSRRPLAGLMFGLWLTLVFVVRLYIQIAKGSDDSALLSVLAVVWPLLPLLFGGYSLVPRNVDTLTAILLGVFVLTATLSCFISPIPLVSIGFLAATLAGIYVAMIFSSILMPPDIALGLRLYALCTIALLLAYAAYDHRGFEGYRLGEGTGTMNPNSLGMIAMSVVAAAFCFRSIVIRFALIAVAMAVIYSTGSRAAAVAAIATASIILWFDFLRAAALIKVLVVLPSVLGIAYYAGAHWDTVYLAMDHFFQWDDRHRGLASGGSGRTLIWAEMWRIIRENLLVGVGYRAHTEFLKIATSAHNGYLALFAEIGLFGFLAIIILILRRLWLLLRRYAVTKTSLLAVYCGFYCGLLLLSVFERYLLNIGNPASLLFLVVLFGGIRQETKPARHPTHAHQKTFAAVNSGRAIHTAAGDIRRDG